MTVQPASVLACVGDHCITCADEGVPMTVLAVDERCGLAQCATEAGACSEVEIALVAPVVAGDRLLVHAGVAIVALTSAPGGAGVSLSELHGADSERPMPVARGRATA